MDDRERRAKAREKYLEKKKDPEWWARRQRKMGFNTRRWRRENKGKFKMNSRAWRERNKERIRAKAREHNAKFPWYQSWTAAKQKCENPKHPMYEKIGGAGIAFRISKDDVAALWERDGASGIRYPSLDRIDPAGDFVLSNCRFVAWRDVVNRLRDKNGTSNPDRQEIQRILNEKPPSV